MYCAIRVITHEPRTCTRKHTRFSTTLRIYDLKPPSWYSSGHSRCCNRTIAKRARTIERHLPSFALLENQQWKQPPGINWAELLKSRRPGLKPSNATVRAWLL